MFLAPSPVPGAARPPTTTPMPSRSIASTMPDGPTPAAPLATPDLYRLLVETVRDYAIFMLDRTGPS